MSGALLKNRLDAVAELSAPQFRLCKTDGKRNGVAMDLYNLLVDAGIKATAKHRNVQITSLTSDSRQVEKGSLFVAVKGETVDGHDYIGQAIAQGAAVVIAEKAQDKSESGCCFVQVADGREALSRLAASFYGHPEREMTLVGITGTNGKTTTTYLLEKILKKGGINPGVIGTVNYRYAGREAKAPFTTPEPVTLFKLIRRMADAGVSHLVMEVSSHALSQKRLFGLKFDVAVFTNLSRDHLDFHGNMADYFAAKKELFTAYLKPGATAVIVDFGDKWGLRLAADIDKINGRVKKTADRLEIITCGRESGSLRVEDFHYDLGGMAAEVILPAARFHLTSKMAGEFNLKNMLAAAGVGAALGLDPEIIRQGLSDTSAIPGRMQRIETTESKRRGLDIFVDFAHTPDALENVLGAIRDLNPRRLLVIFGCGGDRDQGKRAEMGAAAAQLADITIVTADNPRSEDPAKILRDIEVGIINSPTAGKAGGIRRQRLPILMRERRRGYDIIESRRQAISEAIRYAVCGDVILISGKGHEDYQITSEGKKYFDDRFEARSQLAVIKW